MSKTTIPTGGITDGTIASGDLADDAVTAAKIADAVGLGKILQAQSTSSTSRTVVSASTFTGCGLSDTITGATTSSKVLVIVSAEFDNDSNNASVTNTHAIFQLTRNHSGISETEIYQVREGHNRPENSGMDMIFIGNLAIIFLDSPSTTNELTYTLNVKNDPSTSGTQIPANNGESHKAMTLIEVGA